MVPKAGLVVLEAAVDYCTVTMNGSKKLGEVTGARAAAWLHERCGEGFKAKPFSAFGFVGERTDGISVGKRDDMYLIRLSGEMARRHAPVALTWATNVTRMDLQVTLQDDNVKRNWSELVYRHMEDQPGVSSGTPTVRLISGKPDGSTCYIGQRISHRMMRVYDKWAETDGRYPPGSWRWEMEYKQDVAGRGARHLAKSTFGPRSIIACLQGECERYGFDFPSLPLGVNWRPLVVKLPTDDERRLEWIRTSVRPTIIRMLETYDIDTITTALQLPLYPSYSEGGPIEADDDLPAVPTSIG